MNLFDSSLGALAVVLGFAAREVVESTLAVQREMTADDFLGELLVSRGTLRREELDVLLGLQKKLRSKDPLVRADGAMEAGRITGVRVRRLAAEIRTVATGSALRLVGGSR